jgi:branched-chain amino acid transport system ATP-binding protein
MIRADNVHKSFGSLEVLKGIDLVVKSGEVCCVLGPSGSGKSTFLRCVNHLEKINAGKIFVDGDLVGYHERGGKLHEMKDSEVARQRQSIGMVFQRFNLFPHMTALENVMVGRYCRTSSGALTSVLRGPKFRREEAATTARAQELLEFVGLGKSTEHLARNMPYGDQRRLEIARALATDPKLILLDEPTAGMNPQETRQASDLIFKIRDSGLSVVVIEHDMRFIFNLCDRVLCLVRGEALIEGTPHEVQSDPRVIEAYIGTGEEDDEEEVERLQDAPAEGEETP